MLRSRPPQRFGELISPEPSKRIAETRTTPSLAEVLSYQNEDVVSRFAEDHDVSLADSEDIFLETKRWLWLCAKRKIAVDHGEVEFLKVPLFNEAYAIDLMWHTFLLFSEDYATFCEKHFGFFVHHHPKSKSERLKWQTVIAADPDTAKKERRESLQKVYEYLYDELGPEILLKWCDEFPARFKFSQHS